MTLLKSIYLTGDNMGYTDLYKIDRISEDRIIVFGTSYRNPINHLSLINDEIREHSYNGEVVFDLLLSNGNSSNRFVSASIRGFEIDRSSMRLLKHVDSSIKRKAFEFFRENIELFENSVLPEEEKFFIRKELFAPAP